VLVVGGHDRRPARKDLVADLRAVVIHARKLAMRSPGRSGEPAALRPGSTETLRRGLIGISPRPTSVRVERVTARIAGESTVVLDESRIVGGDPVAQGVDRGLDVGAARRLMLE
jgi:hypothetical protein